MNEPIAEPISTFYPSNNKWVAFVVVGALVLVIVIFSLRKDQLAGQAIATPTPTSTPLFSVKIPL